MRAQVAFGVFAAIAGVVILGVLWALGVISIGDAVVVASWLIAASGAWVTWRVVAGSFAADKGGSDFDRAARGPAPAVLERPAMLEMLDGLVAERGLRAGDLHFGLRPILRDIAATALGNTDFGPRSRVKTRIDPALWDLLRDDRPPPDDRAVWALNASELPPMLQQLEEMFEWR